VREQESASATRRCFSNGRFHSLVLSAQRLVSTLLIFLQLETAARVAIGVFE
jgi:hypothetical protein